MEQNNLAIRIVDLREKIGMTQTDLAKKMGFDKSTMSKVENGTRKVSSDELRKLSKIFDVSADYLLGSGNKPSKKTADLADKETIFTFEGKEIPPEDLEYMKRILLGGQHK